MMKFLQAFVLLLAVLLISALIGLMILKPQFDKELQKLIHKTEGRNIEINFLDYGKVRLIQNRIVLSGVRLNGVTRIQHPYFEPREFDLSIKQIRLGLMGITGKSFKIVAEVLGMDVKGGRILNEDKEDHERLESVTGLDFETGLVIEGSPFSWKSQILERAKWFKAWAFDDRPIQDLKLHGRAVFIVEDWPISIRFHSAANAEGFVHLEGNPEDLRVIAEMIEPKFTDSDLNLAAKNLLKTPRLLSIRTAAEMRAVALKKRDPQVAYDVPRHIFWSYWLTKAYGADFAREATNAHEIGDALNSEVESEKDRHHNALGIEYANRKLSEAEVEKMIFKDPRVVRKKKILSKASSSQVPEQKQPAARSSAL